MNETWIAFIAGAAWLAVFTAGLFAFANWVQRRDHRRRDDQDRARYDQINVTGKSRPLRNEET
ncbi:hypothetical protein P8631_11705 [Guyparkeria sp. 1SP6A2]|nr:hypothetical protein [Guyparkeria sp. 1SP6A2]